MAEILGEALAAIGFSKKISEETEAPFRIAEGGPELNSRMRVTRIKDAVLTKIYDWMNGKDYVFRKHLAATLARSAAVTMRSWPLFSNLLKGMFPTYIPRSTVETTVLMQLVAGVLYDELDADDQWMAREKGRSYVPWELYALAERIRINDFAVYKANLRSNEADMKPVKFHEIFRPADER